MNAHLGAHAGAVLAWVLAPLWVWKTVDAVRGLKTVARLDRGEWDTWPESLPGLTVVVPGRNEGAHVDATLQSLVEQDYRARGDLRIVAVDDRSLDETGALMDAYAMRLPGCVSAMHITELPQGWLGKVHALHLALGAGPPTEFVLLTDADIRFDRSVLRRALAYAERERVDHMSIVPTAEIRSWPEGILLGMFHTFVLWAARPWKVPDPRAQRDVIGVGAFNLVRRSALASIGGLEPQAMVVLEDLTLARRLKSAGLRSRITFAPGMVRVHWAAGVRGQIGVMGKNLFSAFNFRLLPAIGASAGLAMLGLMPLFALLGWNTLPAALIVWGCVIVMYRICARFSLIPPGYWWTFPFAAVLFSMTLLRSIAIVIRDGGVRWRGTLYSLRELRKWNDPFRWNGQRQRS